MILGKSNFFFQEQGPVGEAGKIAKLEGFPYQSVKELRLDFRSILKIENLWQFVGLTKLQLDNNIIEVIAGIEKLVNLTWLDLSFNHIENIEGMSTPVLQFLYQKSFSNKKLRTRNEYENHRFIAG